MPIGNVVSAEVPRCRTIVVTIVLAVSCTEPSAPLSPPELPLHDVECPPGIACTEMQWGFRLDDAFALALNPECQGYLETLWTAEISQWDGGPNDFAGFSDYADTLGNDAKISFNTYYLEHYDDETLLN